jgi:plastocyanin
LIAKKIIIPPKFSELSRNISSLRFFSPRLIVIQLGQAVEFKNEDEKPHFIESVDLEEKADSFFVTGQITSGQSKTIILRNLKKMIPYRCRTHPEERGVILMTEKE